MSSNTLERESWGSVLAEGAMLRAPRLWIRRVAPVRPRLNTPSCALHVMRQHDARPVT